MIKIKKQGIKPKRYKYIYTIECNQCGCVFECEVQDFDIITKDIQNPMGTIECPCCNTQLVRYFNTIQKRKEEER